MEIGEDIGNTFFLFRFCKTSLEMDEFKRKPQRFSMNVE
jgi:hypothetical protein